MLWNVLNGSERYKNILSTYTKMFTHFLSKDNNSEEKNPFLIFLYIEIYLRNKIIDFVIIVL